MWSQMTQNMTCNSLTRLIKQGDDDTLEKKTTHGPLNPMLYDVMIKLVTCDIRPRGQTPEELLYELKNVTDTNK